MRSSRTSLTQGTTHSAWYLSNLPSQLITPIKIRAGRLPGDSFVSDHVVNSEYQLPGLKVEGDRHLPGERRDETLHVLAVDQLLQASLLRHHQSLPGPQEAGHQLGQEVRNLVSRLELPT